MSLSAAFLILVTQTQAPAPAPIAEAAPPANVSHSEATEPAQPRVVRGERGGMGTRLEILVYTADEAGARDAINAALDEMSRAAALLSEWSADSDVSRINRAAPDAVPVSKETLEVLGRAKAIAAQTSGAFAATWAALGSLWDFRNADSPAVPEAGKVQAKLPLVGDAKIELDTEKGTVKLPEAGMALGLGGIGKGYALDRALQILRARGFADALVFAGGDIVVSGKKGDASWLVGLQDPRGAGYFAVLPLEDRAIATSGDYEQFFELDGTRYHHILDPRTGMPARGVRSVTVVASTGVDADAYATGLFVLGPQKGLELAEATEGLEAVFVTADNEVLMTKGLSDVLKVLQPPTP